MTTVQANIGDWVTWDLDGFRMEGVVLREVHPFTPEQNHYWYEVEVDRGLTVFVYPDMIESITHKELSYGHN